MLNTVLARYLAPLLAVIVLVLTSTMLPSGTALIAFLVVWTIGVVLVRRGALRTRTAPNPVQGTASVAVQEYREVLNERQPCTGANYVRLYDYLERRFASTVVLTFDQVESLLGFALPLPAATDREWWTATVAHDDRHSEAWIVAGRNATPNLLARTIAFERLP